MTALAPACAHALHITCVSDDARVASWFETSDFLPSKPPIVAFPTFVQRHAELVMSLEDGPYSQTEGPCKRWRDNGRMARHHVMFGPVVTSEAHVALAGASQHTNNTAELSGITESLISSVC